MKKSKFLFILLFLALASGAFLYFRDTAPPQISLTPDTGAIAPGRPLILALDDQGRGLKNISVTLIQQGGAHPLLIKSYPPGTLSARENLSLDNTALTEGPFDIVISATDHAIYHFGAGNTAEKTLSFTFDKTPPIVNVTSTGHNFVQGGASLVTYTLNEPVEKTGVTFSDRFIPAYKQPSGSYACLVPFPNDLAVNDFVPKIVAVDTAGNERITGIFYRAKKGDFRQRRIDIDDRFLQAKTPEFQSLVPNAGSPLDIFLAVNRELRAKNRQELATLSLQTSPTPLWQGKFLRQPQSATLALYGDRRSYYYQGRKIDNQIHLGIDLASVAQAPVIASNSGKIVFAGYFGIYGQCVVIDHGLGLQTLYGHLSQITVTQGEDVTRDQVIGHTGNTGMAGGDHLHFGVVVAGIPVNPVEWWDGTWVKNNITSRL